MQHGEACAPKKGGQGTKDARKKKVREKFVQTMNQLKKGMVNTKAPIEPEPDEDDE